MTESIRMTTYQSPHDEADRIDRAMTDVLAIEAIPDCDMYVVTTLAGEGHVVDLREGRCTCPDYEYRHLEHGGMCKHLFRTVFETGQVPGRCQEPEL